MSYIVEIPKDVMDDLEQFIKERDPEIQQDIENFGLLRSVKKWVESL